MPLGALRPVLAGKVDTADLATVLGGKWLCRDAEACLVRVAQDPALAGTLTAAILPAEDGAGGTVCLITADPRRAEEYAAMVRGATVTWPIHTDYREGK
jgi:hypothetical protein